MICRTTHPGYRSCNSVCAWRQSCAHWLVLMIEPLRSLSRKWKVLPLTTGAPLTLQICEKTRVTARRGQRPRSRARRTCAGFQRAPLLVVWPPSFKRAEILAKLSPAVRSSRNWGSRLAYAVGAFARLVSAPLLPAARVRFATVPRRPPQALYVASAVLVR
jgi:hypothetical protein